MDGCTVSHASVFVTRRSRRANWNWPPAKVFVRYSSTSRTPQFCTSILTSRRQAQWSAIRNSSWPLRAATRCPVMTHEAVQFSRAVFVGSGRSGPACFTGRRVTLLPGVPSPRPWNRAGMKVSRSACYTGPKAPLMPEAT